MWTCLYSVRAYADYWNLAMPWWQVWPDDADNTRYDEKDFLVFKHVCRVNSLKHIRYFINWK